MVIKKFKKKQQLLFLEELENKISYKNKNSFYNSCKFKHIVTLIKKRCILSNLNNYFN